jgi:hypothetical protein
MRSMVGWSSGHVGVERHTGEMSRGGECPPIRLSNGTVIEDPVTVALAFFGTGVGYRNYDAAPVVPDDTLTEADVRVANRSTARMSNAVVAGILSRREAIGAALRRIPADASLTDEEAAIPWDGLRSLVAAFDDVPAIGLARITKVMHRKRPALLPLLDSVVEAYLVGLEPVPRAWPRPERAVALTRIYRREMELNRRALACLRVELAARGFVLTECRLFDVFAWSSAAGWAPKYGHQRDVEVRP